MSQKQKLVGSLVVLVAIVATVTAGISSGATSPPAVVVSALSTPVTSASGIEAREAFVQTAKKGVDPSTLPGKADLAKGVPAPIAGSNTSAWLAPEGEDVCLFVPSPTGNYGSSCFTKAAIEAGAAVITIARANGDVKDTVTVAQIVADGHAGPGVAATDGAKSTMAVQSNVAAAVLPASDTVSTGLGDIELKSLIQKPTLHAAG